jgi:hypothetical protein
MVTILCILVIWLVAASVFCLLVAGAARGDAQAARQLADSRRRAQVRPIRGSIGSAAR